MIENYQVGKGRQRYSSIRANEFDYCLVHQTDGFIDVYGDNGLTFILRLPGEIRSDAQVVFSRVAPGMVYYFVGRQLWSRHILDTKISDLIINYQMIVEFTDYDTVTAAHAEGDLTEDYYIAVCGVKDGVESIFTYNIANCSIGRQFVLDQTFDGLKATIDGHMILSRADGCFAYLQNGGILQLTPKNGHACPAVLDGRPVFLWCSNARREDWDNSVEMYDVATGKFIRELIDFNKDNYACHISFGDGAAWVSNYDPSMQLPNQVWKCYLDDHLDKELMFEWRAKYRDYESTPRFSYNKGVGLFNFDDGTDIWVHALDFKNTNTKPQVTVDTSEKFTEIDYTPFEGRKFRLEQDFVARGGRLVATNSIFYEKK